MESISVFDIFKIGVGPSSSHTMGPWRAAEQFLNACRDAGIFDRITRIKVDLYGSLAKTGKGHGTDIAVMMGLASEDPVTCDTSAIHEKIESIQSSRKIKLGGVSEITFDTATDLVFNNAITLPFHPNGLKLTAFLDDGSTREETYFSIGGGFIAQETNSISGKDVRQLPMPIITAGDLLRHCRENHMTISEVVRKNELTWRESEQISSELMRIWQTMKECVFRGCHKEGILPGGLGVVRRAASLNRKLIGERSFDSADEWVDAIRNSKCDFQTTLKWVSCFALAVNEENASFGRVVTAPTNGAAGVIPAVLMYYVCFCKSDDESIETFLLTAGELGSVFKKGATISAAMGGCQAEIGVSSAMAAGALTQCMGGSTEQTLMATEIAMEHHLGLTCDPVGGLVQIPCIERNTMGAIKAITASSIALESDPHNAKVSLDTVIRSMWDTAQDMNTRYKETSEGGLALHIPVNVIEC